MRQPTLERATNLPTCEVNQHLVAPIALFYLRHIQASAVAPENEAGSPTRAASVSDYPNCANLGGSAAPIHPTSLEVA